MGMSMASLMQRSDKLKQNKGVDMPLTKAQAIVVEKMKRPEVAALKKQLLVSQNLKSLSLVRERHNELIDKCATDIGAIDLNILSLEERRELEELQQRMQHLTQLTNR